MSNTEFDVVVIGAGMGGMCAAARLTGDGKKVLLIEKSSYLGGRCSHRRRHECLVTTGALMLPMGPKSAIREAFDAVGADMDMVDLTGKMRYRLAHGDYDTPAEGGGLYGMIEFAMQDESAAEDFFKHFQDALFHWAPLNSISILDWFDQYTDNQELKNLFQGYAAALMGVNLPEIPASEFFGFLEGSSKGSRFGMARKGNGALLDTLAEAITTRGSEVRCRTSCKQILVDNGKVVGVTVNNAEGKETIIKTDIVLSNTGPDRTVELAGGEELFEKSYIARLHTDAHDAPIMHASFVMNRPLIEGFQGCMVLGNTRNLIYLEIPSEISPMMSPKGQYLHTAYGAPADAANPNMKLEFVKMMEELEVNFPGVSTEATFLVKAKHRGQSPGMRRWIGRGMPVNTPIRGLYNVGDGAAPSGTIGTESAAASAREAVAMLAKNNF